MNYMLHAHRAMFAFLLVLAFFTGAINESRKNMIEKLTARDLLKLSIYELPKVDLDRIKL